MDQERLERAVEAVRSRTSCNRRAVLVAVQRLLQVSWIPANRRRVVVSASVADTGSG